MSADLHFESSDLRETEEFLAKAYTPMSIGAAATDAHTTIDRRWLGAISVDELSFDFDMHYESDPLGKICLCRVHRGRIDERFAGQSDVYSPGDITVWAPPDLPNSGEVRRAAFDLTSFDTAHFERIAATAPASSDTTIRLTSHRAVSSAAENQLGSFLTYLRSTVLTDDECRRSELVAETALSHLTGLVLAAFPNNAETDPTATDRLDAHPALLRRALSFIDDNAHNPISIADIAAHIYVSPRAVQLMFRKHLQCTPTEYIRRVRLNHAHHDLIAAHPTTDSVGNIARRWGFAHIGRFAAHYKQAYGQNPHLTLRF